MEGKAPDGGGRQNGDSLTGLTPSSTGLTHSGVSAEGAALNTQVLLGNAGMVGPLGTSPGKPAPLTGDSLACLSLAPKWAAGPCHRPGEGSGPVQGDLLTVLLVAKAHPGSGPK